MQSLPPRATIARFSIGSTPNRRWSRSHVEALQPSVFLACAGDCDRTGPSLREALLFGLREADQLLYGCQRKVRVVFVDLVERRAEFGILNDGIGQNSSTPHNRPTRDLSGNPLH